MIVRLTEEERSFLERWLDWAETEYENKASLHRRNSRVELEHRKAWPATQVQFKQMRRKLKRTKLHEAFD